jgi:hypothetical protein
MTASTQGPTAGPITLTELQHRDTAADLAEHVGAL